MRVVDCLHRRGQHVEQRDGDDDPTRERDQRVELALHAQRNEAAGERREHRQPREWDRKPAHAAQRAQVP
jgi:hypothetical protein